MCTTIHPDVWHDAFIHVTWLIYMCDMTHTYVWHKSITCVPWLMHIFTMTHLHVWHDPRICVTWRIHVCAMTHSYVLNGSFICVTHCKYRKKTQSTARTRCLHVLKKNLGRGPATLNLLLFCVYMCVTRAHSSVRHDSSRSKRWTYLRPPHSLLPCLIHECAMTRSFVQHDTSRSKRWTCCVWMNHVANEWVMSHMNE